MTDANIYLKGIDGSSLGTASSCPIYISAVSVPTAGFIFPQGEPKIVYVPSEPVEKIVYRTIIKQMPVECECWWCRLKRWIGWT